MKRAFTLVAIMAVLVTCSACSSAGTPSGTDTSPDVSSSTSSSAVVATQKPTEAEAADYSVKIVGSSIGKNYDDKPILVVEYAFTNNSDDSVSFGTAIEDKAYQNDIECSSLTVMSDDVDTQQSLNDVRPGKTYNLKVGYLLQDTKTAVEIECKELFNFDDNAAPLLTQTIELK